MSGCSFYPSRIIDTFGCGVRHRNRKQDQQGETASPPASTHNDSSTSLILVANIYGDIEVIGDTTTKEHVD